MKKNIMIITQALTGGGAERLVSDISKGIKDNYNVYIIVYQKSKNEYDYAGERIDLNLFSQKKLGKIICMVKRFLKVRQLKKQYNIDCSISFVPHVDYMNVFTKRKNEKIIIDVVSNMSLAFPKGIKRIFRKYILKKADFLITVSEGVRKDLVDNFKCQEKKIATIYNTCDIKTIEKAELKEEEKEKYFRNEENILITSMGSFRHPKGQWHLLKAFSILKSEFSNVKLILLGDGEYREKLECLAKNLKIEEEVIMPGFVDNPHAFIKKSDMFVFSSIYEGFGNAVIEALACGVPVVSTDCSFGPREVLEPYNKQSKIAKDIEVCKYGILIPPFESDIIDISTKINDNERKLAEAMKILIENPDLSKEYSYNGRGYCEKFDYKNISNEWIKYINKCLHMRG